MLPEKQLLSAVIIYNKFDLMPKINPLWFNNRINLELWKYTVYCFSEYKKLDIDILKTYIFEQKSKFEKEIINRLVSLDGIYPTDNILEDFQEYYINNCLNEYQTFAQNREATTEAKKNLLTETYKKININIDIDDSKNLYDNIHEYISNVFNDKISDRFNSNSIPLTDPNMKSIFGDYLRPFPIIIGGNPGYGKTSLMLNLLHDIDRQKLPGLIFSFEDTIDTLRNKFLAIKTCISIDDIISNQYDNIQKHVLARGEPKSKRIFIIEKPCDMIKFRQIVDKHIVTYDIKYILIDYFQLFYGLKGLSKVEGLEMVAKEFVNIRKDYEIPIVCLSQLSTEEGSKPFLTDLKWCKGLGENARQVFMLYGEAESSKRKCVCVKNTFRGTFETDISFDPKTQRLIRE